MPTAKASAQIVAWLCMALCLLAHVPHAQGQHLKKRHKKVRHAPLLSRGQAPDTSQSQTDATEPGAYPFIHYKANKIYLDNDTVPVFAHLAQADTHKVHIVHLGDSHIQADVFSGAVRQQLQHVFGKAGRGFFFPNRVARSNNPDDYVTSSTGTWTSTKNTLPAPTQRLGASGFAVRTQDSGATIAVKFINPSNSPQGNRLTIWGKPGPASYVPQVALSDSAPLYLQPDPALSQPGYWVYTFPKPVTSGFCMQVAKTATSQNNFVLQGFILENTDSAGVLYHALGVNGAKIVSYLRSPLLAQHLQSLHPTLVLLDVGVNDYYTSQALPAYVTDSLAALVDSVHKAVPAATIMLCSQQPNLRRRRSVPGAKLYADLITDMARKRKGVIAYNFYAVAKGKRSAQAWLRAGLMQKDGVHLTRAGYKLKGQLFTSAFLHAYAAYQKNTPNKM